MTSSLFSLPPPPIRKPPLVFENALNLSLIELAIDRLLEALGANALAATEADELCFIVKAVHWTVQLGNALDAPPVLRLPQPNAYRGESSHHEEKERTTRHDQRDE
ncbi:MAG: hypothetical protein ABJD07_04760 [Gemmatimonadaceae bacterium]